MVSNLIGTWLGLGLGGFGTKGLGLDNNNYNKMWHCNVWANSVRVVNLSVVLGTGVSVSALKASLSFIVTSKWRGHYGGYDEL